MTAGKKIEKVLEVLGLTKSEMARQMKVSPQLIGQYVSGRQMPNFNFISKFKELYEIDLVETNVSFDAEVARAKFLFLKKKMDTEGYNPHAPILTDAQRDSSILAILNDVEEILKYTFELISFGRKQPVQEILHESLESKQKRLNKIMGGLAGIEDFLVS